MDKCEDKFLRFDLDYDEVIILDRKAAVAANQEILLQHGIPCDRSTGPDPAISEVNIGWCAFAAYYWGNHWTCA